jgi:hypothetical protein
LIGRSLSRVWNPPDEDWVDKKPDVRGICGNAKAPLVGDGSGGPYEQRARDFC